MRDIRDNSRMLLQFDTSTHVKKNTNKPLESAVVEISIFSLSTIDCSTFVTWPDGAFASSLQYGSLNIINVLQHYFVEIFKFEDICIGRISQ